MDLGTAVAGHLETGIADACFESTGKVLDVLLKSTHCKNCEEKKNIWST